MVQSRNWDLWIQWVDGPKWTHPWAMSGCARPARVDPNWVEQSFFNVFHVDFKRRCCHSQNLSESFRIFQISSDHPEIEANVTRVTRSWVLDLRFRWLRWLRWLSWLSWPSCLSPCHGGSAGIFYNIHFWYFSIVFFGLQGSLSMLFRVPAQIFSITASPLLQPDGSVAVSDPASELSKSRMCICRHICWFCWLWRFCFLSEDLLFNGGTVIVRFALIAGFAYTSYTSLLKWCQLGRHIHWFKLPSRRAIGIRNRYDAQSPKRDVEEWPRVFQLAPAKCSWLFEWHCNKVECVSVVQQITQKLPILFFLESYHWMAAVFLVDIASFTWPPGFRQERSIEGCNIV